ncbi:hypothetical protein CKO15_10105 [Halorhodospira abdelmalekii]|nr:hypothetical protein [Halorhodospira abdelmalekii]
MLSRVRIAHHISGRIRLKLDLDLAASGFRLPSADALKQANAVLQRLPGIAAVRINPYARSCLIEYDPEQIPDAAWSDLLTGHDSAATATLQRLIAETLEERAVQAVVQEALPVPDRQ